MHISQNNEIPLPHMLFAISYYKSNTYRRKAVKREEPIVSLLFTPAMYTML
jgi:hypothetical protein